MTRRFDRTRRASPCECTGNSPSELVCVYPRIGYTCIRIRPKLGLIRDYWSSVRLPPPAAQIRNPTHTTRLIPTPSPHLPLSCPLSLFPSPRAPSSPTPTPTGNLATRTTDGTLLAYPVCSTTVRPLSTIPAYYTDGLKVSPFVLFFFFPFFLLVFFFQYRDSFLLLLLLLYRR